MSHVDVGAGIHVEPALAGQTSAVQAGATGNQTALNGIQVDLLALARKYNSVKVAVSAQYQLDTGRSLVFKVDLQHRSATTGSGSTWANFGTTGRTLTVTNSDTSTATGEALHQATFEGEGVFRIAKRYIRIVVSPASSGGDFVDTTATATGSINTFRIKDGNFIFGTPDEMPASG